MGNSNGGLLESDDDASINDQASPTPSLYEVGEKVIALHSKQFWEAKVIDVRSGSTMMRQYLVHYSNWSKDWDEWLGVEYLKKYDDNNAQRRICKEKNLRKYNDNNAQHLICKEQNLKKDTKATQASKIKRKKMSKAKYVKTLTERLREEKKKKELKMLLRTLRTQLRKSASASGLLVKAAQVPAREVVDITEKELVGTPWRSNDRPMVELEPNPVTTHAAELSMSWLSLFGPNVNLSHPPVRADLLHLITLPKEMAEQQLKTHEDVLLSSVDHSLRTLLGLNVLLSRVKELSTISNNYRKEKEELENKLRENSSVVDKLAEHFTRLFRKLLSERRATEETLQKKEKEWEAKDAELKAETASLRNSLDDMRAKQCIEMLKYEGAILKRIKKQYPDLEFNFLDSECEEEYVVVKEQ